MMALPWRTLKDVVVHFSKRNKLVLIPMLVVLVLAAVLLVATSGLSYVAPFVYALF
jgi:hypothetical protein